jgi:ectoine hydroxylase-related dioxygenase (phytanoyl-CoA dioxygenase family)
MSYQDFLNDNGYVVIPSFLNKSEVALIRECHSRIVKVDKLKTLTPTSIISNGLLNKFILSDNVVNALKGVMGATSYFMYPNFTIRESIYLSYHNDSFFLPEAVENSMEFPEFIQCSMYLQDNNNIEGGGVSVLPKSHFFKRDERTNVTKNINFEKDKFNTKVVESNAGDLVLWDSRIIHSSTKYMENPSCKKLALQWTVSKTASYAKYFIEYLKNRSDQELHVSDHEAERPIKYFSDMGDIVDSSIPQHDKDILAKQNIKVITIKNFIEE